MNTPFRPPFNANPNQPNKTFIRPQNSFYVFQPRPAVPPAFQNAEFDGKRLRKAVARKTVDYNSSVVKMLETRVWQRDYRDHRAVQPDVAYYTEIVPPMSMLENAANCITTKFVRTSTNKMRCPIFCVLWTPEGRRLITGSSSGEFTLWNGLTFNFETILQAHDSSVRVMVWSRNDCWMVTADQNGYVKYWQSNMNNVKMFQAHKEPVRAISFCPTDTKFATCSDDGTIRIWDFFRCFEERILRGHGADVKGVDWHPTKALIASGSKDSQQPVKLWDPKTGQSLATLHAHKNTVTDIKWNQNGNWLLTSSRDHLIKIYDIRNMSNEMQTFRGHKREVSCLAWHPIHEGLFASGGSDGSILFWLVGTEKEIGCMEQAHESIVWSLSWHPLGHILTSGSNDHACKFWTRNRPGDKMRDRYNLNLLPKGTEENEFEDDVQSLFIPGIDYDGEKNDEEICPVIPGLGFDENEDQEITEQTNVNNNNITSANNNNNSNKNYNQNNNSMAKHKERKPFTKPIPKQFQQQWNNSDNKIFQNNNHNNRRNEFYDNNNNSSNSNNQYNENNNYQQQQQQHPYFNGNGINNEFNQHQQNNTGNASSENYSINSTNFYPPAPMQNAQQSSSNNSIGMDSYGGNFNSITVNNPFQSQHQQQAPPLPFPNTIYSEDLYGIESHFNNQQQPQPTPLQLHQMTNDEDERKYSIESGNYPVKRARS